MCSPDEVRELEELAEKEVALEELRDRERLESGTIAGVQQLDLLGRELERRKKQKVSRKRRNS